MNYTSVIKALADNANTFKALLSGASEELFRWKPAPDKWCLLEIVCHLYDEEREDFRARLKSTLSDPSVQWPQIDPVEWVKSRKYLEQDYESKVSALMVERANSVQWLESLNNPNWKSIYVHPKVGDIPAELLLYNWLAHDYLHFRQITRTKYLFLKAHSPAKLDYAGEWQGY